MENKKCLKPPTRNWEASATIHTVLPPCKMRTFVRTLENATFQKIIWPAQTKKTKGSISVSHSFCQNVGPSIDQLMG